MEESGPYREELRSYALSFDARRIRQLWRGDSMAKAERMLFVGFLFVRKLIECAKVTDACARSSALVSRSQIRRSRQVSAFKRDDLVKDLETADWREAKIDVNQLADKVIHAWWIIPVQNKHNGLEGYVLTTDRMRNKELWFVSTQTVVEVFSRFSVSTIRSLRTQRDAVGKLTFWEAR